MPINITQALERLETCIPADLYIRLKDAVDLNNKIKRWLIGGLTLTSAVMLSLNVQRPTGEIEEESMAKGIAYCGLYALYMGSSMTMRPEGKVMKWIHSGTPFANPKEQQFFEWLMYSSGEQNQANLIAITVATTRPDASFESIYLALQEVQAKPESSVEAILHHVNLYMPGAFQWMKKVLGKTEALAAEEADVH